MSRNLTIKNTSNTDQVTKRNVEKSDIEFKNTFNTDRLK